MLSEQEIWNCLSEIPDPDIPVVSITELGLVRKVEIDPKEKITVSLTPSYSGCPAMSFFQSEIKSALKRKGVNNVEIKIVYSPDWTTDWISDTAKEKMRKHGIAPPEKVAEDEPLLCAEVKKQVACPWCSSINTKRTSQFGSTPCKALWFCNACQQPFEYFKCI